MRTITAAGLSALGLSVVLAAGCSREANQQQPVKTQSDAGASTAPASGQAANDRGEALVRVVNAVPDQPALNVTADQDTAFTHVDYKAVTPYKAISASADDFAIKSASNASAEPIAKNSESIMSGRHYTLVAFPESSPKEAEKPVSLEVIADNLAVPAPGKARVRVINAAAGTDDIAVYLRGQDDALFSDVDFKEAVDYKEVDPVRTTMELRASSGLLTDVNPKTGERPADARQAPAAAADRAAARRAIPNPGEVLATHTLNLESGKSYTIVLTGKMEGTKRQLDTLVVEDIVPESPARTN